MPLNFMSAPGGPQHAGLVVAAGFQAPNLQQHGRMILGPRRRGWEERIAVDLGVFGKHGHGRLLPGRAVVVAAAKLRAEVPEVQRDVERAVARVAEHQAQGVAEEVGAGDLPRLPGSAAAREREQAFAGRDIELVGHLPNSCDD